MSETRQLVIPAGIISTVILSIFAWIFVTIFGAVQENDANVRKLEQRAAVMETKLDRIDKRLERLEEN